MLKIYREKLLKRREKLLSFIDANPESKTYGCCYPAFWRGDIDPMVMVPSFVNARWQEAGYSLALMQSTPFKGNPHYGDESLLNLILAILHFWARQQKANGSFCELRPVGHEQPVTAASTAAMARTWLLVQPFITADDKYYCLRAFKRAAEYLTHHPNAVETTYEAAAIDALYCLHRIMPQLGLDAVCRQKLAGLLRQQSRDGWFREMDGPDFGQNTVLLYHLVHYYNESGDSDAQPMIEGLLRFLRYFIYPDGVCGGGFNTRAAAALVPCGFALLRRRYPEAEDILRASIKAINNGLLEDHMEFMDYFLVREFYKYLEVLPLLENTELDDARVSDLPASGSGLMNRSFSDGCIRVSKRPNYYAVCGKGAGLSALFSYKTGTTLLYSSPTFQTALSGFKAQDPSGAIWSSSMRIEEKRTDQKTTVSSVCTVLPVNLNREDRWSYTSANYELDFLNRWARNKLASAEFLELLNHCWSRSLVCSMRKRRWTPQFDEDEHFILDRQVEFRQSVIACQNRIESHTRPRDFSQAGILETMLIPPYRNADRYRIKAGMRNYALSDFQREQTLQTADIILVYNANPELQIQFDAEQTVRLRWLHTKDHHQNVLRFLNAGCLVMDFDLRNQLREQPGKPVQLNYRLNFDVRVQEEMQLVRRES
ncbi:hypothetical protein JXA32_00975 [Candidatus Sumerlaeota bacterium]|nr:hypothetical protein [Candidatus Sumerlaeota bacterium]